MDTTVCFVMAELIIKNHLLAASCMLITSGTLGLLKYKCVYYWWQKVNNYETGKKTYFSSRT